MRRSLNSLWLCQNTGLWIQPSKYSLVSKRNTTQRVGWPTTLVCSGLREFLGCPRNFQFENQDIPKQLGKSWLPYGRLFSFYQEGHTLNVGNVCSLTAPLPGKTPEAVTHPAVCSCPHQGQGPVLKLDWWGMHPSTCPVFCLAQQGRQLMLSAVRTDLKQNVMLQSDGRTL